MTRMIYPTAGEVLTKVNAVGARVDRDANDVDPRLLNRKYRRMVGAILMNRQRRKFFARIKFARGVAKHGA